MVWRPEGLKCKDIIFYLGSISYISPSYHYVQELWVGGQSWMTASIVPTGKSISCRGAQTSI